MQNTLDTGWEKEYNIHSTCDVFSIASERGAVCASFSEDARGYLACWDALRVLRPGRDDPALFLSAFPRGAAAKKSGYFRNPPAPS